MSDTTACSAPGCDRPVKYVELCNAHYQKLRTYGDPLAGYRSYRSPEESFLARTAREGECLVWTGTRKPSGYGEIRAGGRMVRAHRYAWERVNGPIPKGMQVDHICWNPSCVEITHLRLATPSQNVSHIRGPKGESATGVRNVFLEKNGKFRVQVEKDGVRHRGTFETLAEASAEAERLRQELFGEFAGTGTRAARRDEEKR